VSHAKLLADKHIIEQFHRNKHKPGKLIKLQKQDLFNALKKRQINMQYTRASGLLNNKIILDKHTAINCMVAAFEVRP
jgi:hypothetical protein